MFVAFFCFVSFFIVYVYYISLWCSDMRWVKRVSLTFPQIGKESMHNIWLYICWLQFTGAWMVLFTQQCVKRMQIITKLKTEMRAQSVIGLKFGLIYGSRFERTDEQTFNLLFNFTAFWSCLLSALFFSDPCCTWGTVLRVREFLAVSLCPRCPGWTSWPKKETVGNSKFSVESLWLFVSMSALSGHTPCPAASLCHSHPQLLLL